MWEEDEMLAAGTGSVTLESHPGWARLLHFHLQSSPGLGEH